MKREKYESTRRSRILAAMVTNKDVLARVADRWTHAGLFDVDWANLVGSWCVQHLKTYGEAPDSKIQAIFEDWATGSSSDELVGKLELFLCEMSNQWEREPAEQQDTDYLLDQASEFFTQVAIKRTGEEAQYASTGRLTQAVQSFTGFKPIRLREREARFPVFTTQDLLTGPIRDEFYLIDNAMVCDQPLLICGPEKSMKTSIMLDMVVSLISGRPFLGSLPVNLEQNVLIFSGESGIKTLKKNLRTIYRSRCGRAGRDFKPEHLTANVALSEKVPKATDAADLTEMERLIDEHQSGLVVIDTASFALPGEDGPSMMLMQNHLRRMSDCCKDHGAQLVMLHHTHRLKDPYRPLTLADIAYAGFAEWVRQWVLVSRREAYEPPAAGQSREHQLWLVSGGSAGHSCLWGLDVSEGTRESPAWQIAMSSPTDARISTQKRDVDKHLDSDKTIVLEVLKAYPDGEVPGRLEKPTRRNSDRLKPAIASLVEDGLVEKCRVPRGNNQSYDGYKLTSTLRQNTSTNSVSK